MRNPEQNSQNPMEQAEDTRYQRERQHVMRMINDVEMYFKGALLEQTPLDVTLEMRNAGYKAPATDNRLAEILEDLEEFRKMAKISYGLELADLAHRLNEFVADRKREYGLDEQTMQAPHGLNHGQEQRGEEEERGESEATAAGVGK